MARENRFLTALVQGDPLVILDLDMEDVCFMPLTQGYPFPIKSAFAAASSA